MKRQRAGRISAREKDEQYQCGDASISEDRPFPEPTPEGILSRQAVAGELAILPARHDPRGDYNGNESNRVLDKKHDSLQTLRGDDAASLQDHLYNFLKECLRGDYDD